MTAQFEDIVRPFAAQQVAYPTRYLLPNQRPTPPIRLQWGRNGGGKTMSGNTSLSISYYLGQKIVEKGS